MQIVSESVPTDATSPLDLHGQIISGGIARDYYLHIPSGLKECADALPLVIALHGGGGKGSGMNILTNLNEVSDRHGFIVCCPEGVKHHWNDGRSVSENGLDDVAFVRDLLDGLSASYNVDRSRVYATGISNGGFLSQRLACSLPGSIAAVASVAASVAVELDSICHNDRPVPIMFILGTADPLVPFEGGTVGGVFGARGQVLSASDSIGYWVKRNRCSPKARLIWQADTEDGMTAKQYVYDHFQGGSPVMVYEIEGGGHTWPGGFQYYSKRFIGKTCRTFDASEAIWKFFQSQRISPVEPR